MTKLAEAKIEIMTLKMSKKGAAASQGAATPKPRGGGGTLASMTPKIATPSWLGGGASAFGGLFGRTSESPAAPAAAASIPASTEDVEGDGVMIETRESSRAFNAVALLAIYTKHSADKLGKVDVLAERYAGKSASLLKGLRDKYGSADVDLLIAGEMKAVDTSSSVHSTWKLLRLK